MAFRSEDARVPSRHDEQSTAVNRNQFSMTMATPDSVQLTYPRWNIAPDPRNHPGCSLIRGWTSAILHCSSFWNRSPVTLHSSAFDSPVATGRGRLHSVCLLPCKLRARSIHSCRGAHRYIIKLSPMKESAGSSKFIQSYPIRLPGVGEPDKSHSHALVLNGTHILPGRSPSTCMTCWLLFCTRKRIQLWVQTYQKQHQRLFPKCTRWDLAPHRYHLFSEKRLVLVVQFGVESGQRRRGAGPSQFQTARNMWQPTDESTCWRLVLALLVIKRCGD